jgi:hypothetical protein
MEKTPQNPKYPQKRACFSLFCGYFTVIIDLDLRYNLSNMLAAFKNGMRLLCLGNRQLSIHCRLYRSLFTPGAHVLHKLCEKLSLELGCA